VENIFTDVFYSKFSMEITKQLKEFKPSITRNGTEDAAHYFVVFPPFLIQKAA